MAGPITWRTVNGPSLAEASRPMESAQRSFDNAFTGLGGLLKQQEATDEANWGQVKENNTQAFLNKLYSAQGAEGFKALQDSGELDRMLTANGAQIDRAAARSAMDGRLATLQQRDVQGITYDNTIKDNKQQPVVQQILSEAAAGNRDAAVALMKSNPDLRMPGPLMQAIISGERDLTKFNHLVSAENRAVDEQVWKANNEAQQALLRPIAVQAAQQNLRVQDAQIRSSDASRLLSLAQANRQNAEADELKKGTSSTAKLDAAYKEFVANGPYDKSSLDTAAGQAAFVKGLTDLGLPAAAIEDVTAQTYKYYGKGAVVGHNADGTPIRQPLGVSTALEAVAAAGDNTVVDSFLGWSRRGDQTVKSLNRIFGVNDDGTRDPSKEKLKNTELTDRMQATMALRNQREARLGTFPGNADSAAPAPSPQTSSPAPAPDSSSPKPAPTSDAPPSVFNAGQAAELLRQRKELENGVRKALSPEIQTLLEKDKVQGQAFQATVEKRKADDEAALVKSREDMAKSLGIPAVPKPPPFNPNSVGSNPTTLAAPRSSIGKNPFIVQGAMERRYEAFAEAMDARIADTKKAK